MEKWQFHEIYQFCQSEHSDCCLSLTQNSQTESKNWLRSVHEIVPTFAYMSLLDHMNFSYINIWWKLMQIEIWHDNTGSVIANWFFWIMADRNMRARYFLKMVLKSWGLKILLVQPVFLKCILCANMKKKILNVTTVKLFLNIKIQCFGGFYWCFFVPAFK